MEEDTPEQKKRKITNHGIGQNLDSYDFPMEIKTRAIEICEKINPSLKRGKKRRYLIFFCIHNAYKELGIPIDPKQICLKMGVKNNTINKSASLFSTINTGYQPKNMDISASDLIPGFCQILALDDNFCNGAIQMCDYVLEKNSLLKNEYPQKVAIGVIEYFCTINGIKMDTNKVSKNIQLSTVTIKTINKEIEKAWNL